MPDYLSAGYNDFLLRPLEAGFVEQVGLDSSSSFEQISGLQVKGDKISSLSKSLNLDLQNDAFTVDEGSINRIGIGRLPNGKIGIIIQDNEGNVLFSITGEENIIQTADKKTFFNLAENKLQIADSKGTTLIDGTGLVSLSSFNNDYVTATGVQDTASSTYVDVTGLTLNFTLERKSNVMFACSLQGLNTSANAESFTVASMFLDGTSLGSEMVIGGVPFAVGGPGEGVNPVSASSFVVQATNAGSHNIKVKYKAVLGGTARLAPYIRTLAYLVLGK